MSSAFDLSYEGAVGKQAINTYMLFAYFMLSKRISTVNLEVTIIIRNLSGYVANIGLLTSLIQEDKQNDRNMYLI